MAQEVEIEFKNLLTENEFKRLLNDLPFPSEGTVQTNYYFETADFSLKKHKSALRIRKKNDQYRLTLKEPLDIGLLETHDILTKQEAEAMIGGQPVYKEETGQRLKNMNILLSDLNYFGSLTTIRREADYEGANIVLDYSTYHDTADYELEVEASSEELGKKVFDALLNKYNIPGRNTPNKIERFFSTF